MKRTYLKLRPGDTIYYSGRQYFITGMFSQKSYGEDGELTVDYFAILNPIEFAHPLTITQHFYAPAIQVLPSLLNNQNDGSEWSYLFQDDPS